MTEQTPNQPDQQPPAANLPQCAYEGCSQPVWSDSSKDLCLCHDPNNGKDHDTARQVWLQARNMAQDPNGCSYAGWNFPADPDGKGFNNVAFQGQVVFAKASFQNIAGFSEASFTGIADFSEVTFKYIANFSKSVFHNNASFIGATFQGKVMFFEGAFQGDAMFHMITCKSIAEFSMAKFQGYAAFCRANFQHYAWFTGATFDGDAEFSSVVFLNHARFARATFSSAAEFSTADFQGDVIFSDALFRADAKFIDASFKDGRAILVDRPSWEMPFVKSRPFERADQGELLYRMAKEACRRRGDYRQAGQFHYAEQCAIERGKREACGWKPWRAHFWSCLLELAFARALFGYGEKPHRVLVVGLVLIICWAGLYFALAGIGPNTDQLDNHMPTVSECLHFSVVTFTTLGYGDLVPKPSCRLWADLEAVLGLALMPLFVVGLTRKYVL